MAFDKIGSVPENRDIVKACPGQGGLPHKMRQLCPVLRQTSQSVGQSINVMEWGQMASPMGRCQIAGIAAVIANDGTARDERFDQAARRFRGIMAKEHHMRCS